MPILLLLCHWDFCFLLPALLSALMTFIWRNSISSKLQTSLHSLTVPFYIPDPNPTFLSQIHLLRHGWKRCKGEDGGSPGVPMEVYRFPPTRHYQQVPVTAAVSLMGWIELHWNQYHLLELVAPQLGHLGAAWLCQVEHTPLSVVIRAFGRL